MKPFASDALLSALFDAFAHEFEETSFVSLELLDGTRLGRSTDAPLSSLGLDDYATSGSVALGWFKVDVQLRCPDPISLLVDIDSGTFAGKTTAAVKPSISHFQ